ncbi:MAG: hypothetical protein MHPSP_001449 [Paramarteilia canceri]
MLDRRASERSSDRSKRRKSSRDRRSSTKNRSSRKVDKEDSPRRSRSPPYNSPRSKRHRSRSPRNRHTSSKSSRHDDSGHRYENYSDPISNTILIRYLSDIATEKDIVERLNEHNLIAKDIRIIKKPTNDGHNKNIECSCNTGVLYRIK